MVSRLDGFLWLGCNFEDPLREQAVSHSSQLRQCPFWESCPFRPTRSRKMILMLIVVRQMTPTEQHLFWVCKSYDGSEAGRVLAWPSACTGLQGGTEQSCVGSRKSV